MSESKKKRKMVHKCAKCGAEFKTKQDCWFHIDNECPANPKATHKESQK